MKNGFSQNLEIFKINLHQRQNQGFIVQISRFSAIQGIHEKMIFTQIIYNNIYYITINLIKMRTNYSSKFPIFLRTIM